MKISFKNEHEMKDWQKNMVDLCDYYVRPIIFGTMPPSEKNSLPNNGTITFINTGKKSFGITNHHVINGYRKELAKNKNIKLQVKGLLINLENRIIDESERLDIITLEFNESEFKKIKVTPLNHNIWPPYEPQKKEAVFILGYPGTYKEHKNQGQLSMGHVNLTLLVEDVSYKSFIVELVRSNWIVTNNSKKDPDLKNWGGFSGSGVFRISELQLELIGIISDCPDKPKDFEFFRCSRTDLILPDGTLNHSFD